MYVVVQYLTRKPGTGALKDRDVESCLGSLQVHGTTSWPVVRNGLGPLFLLYGIYVVLVVYF